MEHLIRNLRDSRELTDAIRKGYDDLPEESEDDLIEEEEPTTDGKENEAKLSTSRQGAASRASTVDGKTTPTSAKAAKARESKRIARLSMSDVADRHLREKTEAIADIIRNISEQCAAAVAGLSLAQDAELENAASSQLSAGDDNLDQASRTDGSEMGDHEASGHLTPEGRSSSIPPTPDLVHRSSTSMSTMSSSTFPERSSQQYSPGDIPTKIVEDDDEYTQESAYEQEPEPTNLSKHAAQTVYPPATTRIVS
jgi:hypothetical protein